MATILAQNNLDLSLLGPRETEVPLFIRRKVLPPNIPYIITIMRVPEWTYEK
jgi:hypothetical protein